MIFYLTAPDCNALRRTDVPLFVNHYALFGGRCKTLPRALGPWCLDSGGYTQLRKKSNNGRWPFTPEEYVRDVRRCVNEIGKLQWAATMDWMTEDEVLAETKLDVREHQYRTIESYLDLRRLGGPELENLWLPVLQGRCPEDYFAHYQMYMNEGIALEQANWVGVGSVCRLGAEDRIASVFGELNRRGLHRLHAFGLKKTGLRWEDIETRPLDPSRLRLAELYRTARERGHDLEDVEAAFQLTNTTWEQVSSQVCSMIYSSDSNAWGDRAKYHANDVRRVRDGAFGGRASWAELAGVIYEYHGPRGTGAPVTSGGGVKGYKARKATKSKPARMSAVDEARPYMGRILGHVELGRLGEVHHLAPTQMREDCARGRINRTRGFMHESCNSHLEYGLDWRDELKRLLAPIGCWHETPYYRELPPPPFAPPELRAEQTVAFLKARGLWPPGNRPPPPQPPGPPGEWLTRLNPHAGPQ